MTIRRPTTDDIMQTRLAASRQIAQLPSGSLDPDGFAWSQSYRQDVAALLARLSTAETERCQAQDEAWANWSSYKAAEARAEAAEQALRMYANPECWLGTVWNGEDMNDPTALARAALTRSGGDELECTCSEINARHCPRHNAR